MLFVIEVTKPRVLSLDTASAIKAFHVGVARSNVELRLLAKMSTMQKLR